MESAWTGCHVCFNHLEKKIKKVVAKRTRSMPTTIVPLMQRVHMLFNVRTYIYVYHLRSLIDCACRYVRTYSIPESRYVHTLERDVLGPLSLYFCIRRNEHKGETITRLKLSSFDRSPSFDRTLFARSCPVPSSWPFD